MKTIRQRTVDAHGRPVRQMIEAKQSVDTALELYIYDDIEPDTVNWWTGEVTESETSAAAIKAVLDEHKDVDQINLYVNSRGGSVLEAMGIRAHLLRHPAKKTAYVDGWAASAASFLLTACDEVLMLTGSMQMLHSMWIMMAGNAAELRKAADDLDRIMVGNRQMYLEKAGDKLTEEKLIELMDAETWLNATECIELGLADRVLAAAEYNKIKQKITFAMMGLEKEPETDPVEEVSEPEIEPEEIGEEAAIEPSQETDEGDPEEAPPQQEEAPPSQNLLAAFVRAAERKEL